MTHPQGRDPVGIAQDARGQGGVEYPLVNPSSDVKYLLADLWLGFIDEGYRYPFAIKWLYGFGADAAVVPFTPVHSHGLEIVDADGRTVFSTQDVPSSQFLTTAWDSRLAVLQWWHAGQVLRVAYHTDWSADDTPQSYPEYFEPARATLAERAACPLPRRLLGFRVGNQVVDAQRVVFANGYNNQWQVGETALTDGAFRDNPLTLDTSPGLGLGRFGDGCDELVEPPIRSINHVGGDARGNLLLDASDCFRVTRPVHAVLDEASRQLRLRDHALLLSSDCGPCCNCDDFIAVWEAMRRMRDKCAGILQTVLATRDLYHANRQRFIEQQQCRDQDRLRLRLQPLCPDQLSVSAGYCNNSDQCLTGVVLHISFDYEDASGCREAAGNGPLKAVSTLTTDVVCDSGIRGGNTDPAQLMSGGGFSRRQQEPYQLGGSWPHYWAWFDLVDPGATAYVTFRLSYSGGTASDRVAAIVDAYHTGGAAVSGSSPVPGYTPGAGPTTPEAMAMRLVPCPKYAATGLLLDCCDSSDEGGGGGGFDPEDFAPAIHTHPIDDVAGLSLSLANIYDALDNIDAGPHTHVIDDVEHLSLSLATLEDDIGDLGASLGLLAQDILDLADVVSGKADTGHGHSISDVSGLQTALDSKASSTHGHAIADVTGLSAALAGKADNGHTHPIDDVEHLSLSLASLTDDIAEIYEELGGRAVVDHDHVIDDVDNLSLSLAAIDEDLAALYAALDDVVVGEHTHVIDDVEHLSLSLANLDDRADGLTQALTQLSLDLAALELVVQGKADEAHDHAIDDVDDLSLSLAAIEDDIEEIYAELGGRAVINHGHVINDVEHLSLSLAAMEDDIDGLGASLGLLAQDILDLAGVVSGKADTGHSHSISDVSGLQTALDSKASSTHGHAISDVTGLQTALDGKADDDHGHSIADVSGLQSALDDLGSNLTAVVLPSICDGRLTLTSGVPVLSSDVIGAGTLYWTPYKGNQVSLYDGSQWQLHTFTELSLALSVTAATNYDVFVYDNGGTLTLELTAWTDDTTRATDLTRQDGVLVKSGDATRRYLGTLRASGTNTCECSFTLDDGPRKLFLYNHYHQVTMVVQASDTVNPLGYTYSTATYRKAQNADRTKVEFVLGDPQQVRFEGMHRSRAAVVNYRIAAIGIDSASASGNGIVRVTGPYDITMRPQDAQVLQAGYHFAHLLEYGDPGATNTWYTPRILQATFLA